MSYASVWEDYDDDGDPVLYVANDFGRNNLYRNEDDQFTDVAGASGMSVSCLDRYSHLQWAWRPGEYRNIA